LAKDKRSFVRQLDRALNENDPAPSCTSNRARTPKRVGERLDRIEAELGKMTNVECRMTKEARMLK
jgi:hypothetical protein